MVGMFSPDYFVAAFRLRFRAMLMVFADMIYLRFRATAPHAAAIAAATRRCYAMTYFSRLYFRFCREPLLSPFTLRRHVLPLLQFRCCIFRC